MNEEELRKQQKDHIFKKGSRYKIPIYLFFILICITYIVPLMLIISASLSSEAALNTTVGGNGKFSLFPQQFTLDAYKLAFENPTPVLRVYFITAAQSIVGTVLSCVVCGMIAYAISRSSFSWRKPITFIVFFTMLFGGGTIPTYIIYTKYYGLGNSFWIYILPGITGGAWNTLMIKTFFRQLPQSLFESAKLDGASELTIFARIAVPLSKPVFATISFMMLIGKWQDWNTSLIYVRNDKLYTIQYFLQKILMEQEFLKRLSTDPELTNIISDVQATQPMETLKYALCIIAAGPMMVVFPFFQKYLVKGITVGSVKE